MNVDAKGGSMGDKNAVTRREMLGHALGAIGQNMIYALWSTYILKFYTDVFGITGAVAGTIMLFTRIFDAVNDPFMGIIADRTRTRWGRFRPWLLFSCVPAGICLILCFSSPDFSPTGKIAYAAITYVMLSMFYTTVDVPYWSLPSAMASDPGKRASIFGGSRLVGNVCVIVVTAFGATMVNLLGKGNPADGFQRTAMVCAAIAVMFYLISFSMVREHITVQQKTSFSFEQVKNAIFRNKPLLMILLATICTSALAVRNNMQLYYMEYNMGNENLMTIFTIGSLPGLLIGLIITPVLARKFGSKRTYQGVHLFSVISNVIFFFVGYRSLPLTLGAFMVASLPIGANTVLISTMISDTIEYVELKSGQRSEGVISSMQTFVSKLNAAIGSGIAGFLLWIANYKPGVQPEATLMMFQASVSLVPAIGSLLALFPICFYEITPEKHRRMREELEKRRSQQEE